MNPEAKTTVALKSRQQAESYSGHGNFGRAFAHYLVALKLKPEWKNELKQQFSTVLCKLCWYLHFSLRYQHKTKWLLTVIKAKPNS